MYAVKLLLTESESEDNHLLRVGGELNVPESQHTMSPISKDGLTRHTAVCGKESDFDLSVIGRVPESSVCSKCIAELDSEGVRYDSMVRPE